MNITVAEMKVNLSEILRRAAKGEDISVIKHGKPYVKIAADKPAKKKSLHGVWKGKFVVPDDFDELGPEWDKYIQ
jgi:antitoxin (DNA-binding transcriptional repressor) of toxin-antitoxin stability system